MAMILDDFVMLGKTVPEANSDGREFVCTAGYSFELRQAVRIYPMARAHCPQRWAMCRVPVERNAKDSRTESWKIKGDRSPRQHWNINSVISVQGSLTKERERQREIIRALTVGSLKEANSLRLSLCVILPREVPEVFFERGETAQMAPTPDLFNYLPALPVKQRFDWHPRLQFSDEDGDHDLMLRDWGCYELMRKQPEKISIPYLEDALNISTAAPLLCGNLNSFRNSWLVISVFSGTIHARPQVSEYQTRLAL